MLNTYTSLADTCDSKTLSIILQAVAEREQSIVNALVEKIRYELDFAEDDKTTQGRITGLEFALAELGISHEELQKRLSR